MMIKVHNTFMNYSGLLSHLPHVKKEKRKEENSTWISTSLQIYPTSSQGIQVAEEHAKQHKIQPAKSVV